MRGGYRATPTNGLGPGAGGYSNYGAYYGGGGGHGGKGGKQFRLPRPGRRSERFGNRARRAGFFRRVWRGWRRGNPAGGHKPVVARRRDQRQRQQRGVRPGRRGRRRLGLRACGRVDGPGGVSGRWRRRKTLPRGGAAAGAGAGRVAVYHQTGNFTNWANCTTKPGSGYGPAERGTLIWFDGNSGTLYVDGACELAGTTLECPGLTVLPNAQLTIRTGAVARVDTPGCASGRGLALVGGRTLLRAADDRRSGDS